MEQLGWESCSDRGGYLIGFIAAALIAGLAYERNSDIIWIAGLTGAMLLIYAGGAGWLMYSAAMGFIPAITAGVLPFIPGDIIKAGAAYCVPYREKNPMITIGDLQFRSLTIDELALGPGTPTKPGLNGSGKTTFLKLCTGIWVPESGSILIDGEIPRDTETGWLNEFPDRNTLFIRVADEIASPLRFRRVPCETIMERSWECTDELGIAHLLQRNVWELSCDEKVLVALAAALIHKPQILGLDKYDSHLDAARSDHVDRF